MDHLNDNQVSLFEEFEKDHDDQIYMDHFEYIHQNQVFSIDPNLKKKNIFFINQHRKKRKKDGNILSCKNKINYHSIYYTCSMLIKRNSNITLFSWYKFK
jgi:hypothetical protein